MAKIDDDDNNDTLHTQGLSEEEIAALADDADADDAEALADLAEADDDTDEDAAAAEDDAEEDEDDADDDADDDEDLPAADTAAKPAADKPAATQAATAVTDDEDAPEFRSVYQVEPVENFDQKMAEFDEQKKALRKQFQDGEIELDAYEEQKDEITAQEQAIREQNLKYTIAVEQNEQNNMARWQWEQDRFFESEANAIYKNPLIMAALDTAVKAVAAAPENASKSAAWFLKEADRQVREAMGLSATKPAGKEDTPPAKNRKPDLSKIPPNLGNLPAAEIPETGSGEFAHLENLDGMKLEQALAKMTPDEQARYLEAA